MNEFRYNSQRAQESRVGKVFEPVVIRALTIITAIVLVALGAYLMFMLHSAIAWICWGLAIAIFVIFVYIKYELLKPPLGPSDDINDLLSRDLLTLFSRTPTPSEIAQIAHKTNSGSFLAVRYAITPNFLSIVAEALPEDITPIFAKARRFGSSHD